MIYTKEINIRDIKISAPELISDGWALVTAGSEKDCNTMTISWGSLGELWGKDVAVVYIRPQRYTREYLDREEYFTVSFYDEKFRNALKICGAKSGRNCDKISESGLSPVETDGTVTFKEAKYTLVCRKIAVQALDPKGFLDPEIETNYSKKDYHIIYTGEIIRAYEN